MNNWIQTYSGKKVSLTDPRPEDIALDDIARALSNICRFTGHTTRFYSVAQHSVLCSEQVPPELQLHALFHDASEAYVGDMSRPLKHVGDHKVYRDCDSRIKAAIAERFLGGKSQSNLDFKTVDLRMLVTEARDLLWGGPHKDWVINERTHPPFDFTIVPWHPDEAMQRFIFRYRQITGFWTG